MAPTRSENAVVLCAEATEGATEANKLANKLVVDVAAPPPPPPPPLPPLLLLPLVVAALIPIVVVDGGGIYWKIPGGFSGSARIKLFIGFASLVQLLESREKEEGQKDEQ